MRRQCPRLYFVKALRTKYYLKEAYKHIKIKYMKKRLTKCWVLNFDKFGRMAVLWKTNVQYKSFEKRNTQERRVQRMRHAAPQQSKAARERT